MKYVLLVSLGAALFLLNSFVFGQHRESSVLSNEVETSYRVFGSGPRAMLIINGGPGMNSNGFESLAKKFAELYNLQVIIYDQRGTGKSKLPNSSGQNISIDLMISDIEAIREQEGLDKWSLFGQSFGGMLASYYATKFPDRIEKLILSSSGGIKIADLSNVNIMGRLTKIELDSFNYWNAKFQNAPSDHHLRFKRNQFLASAYLVGDEYIPTVAKRLGQVNLQMNRLVFSDMYSIGFNCSNELKSFDKPALILIGEEDVVSIDAARETNEILENSQLVIVPKSGHYGWLENPDVYFNVIKRFMEG